LFASVAKYQSQDLSGSTLDRRPRRRLRGTSVGATAGPMAVELISNDLTVSNEKGRSGDAATRNSSIGWRRHAIVARSCQPNLILLYSVFKRSMSSGLTRGRIPVRVKKTRQNRKLEPALIPSKPE
jgi:hypothetical protein